MSASMENKEALDKELIVQTAEEAERPADAVIEAPAEIAAEETVSEDTAEAEEETEEDPDFRPYDVSEDGSPHGPLDLFGGDNEEKKDEES